MSNNHNQTNPCTIMNDYSDTCSISSINSSEEAAIEALLLMAENLPSEEYENNVASSSNSSTEMETDCNNNEYDSNNNSELMNEYEQEQEQPDFLDDGPVGYYEMRTNDTLVGWTYTIHDNSICLTPPLSWKNYDIPYSINVSWYKRPLYYSNVHTGYFISNSDCFVNKVEELGAVFDPDRV